MEDKAQRIVNAAVQLAEEGGFEGVRLRDVASKSGLALGTLYARFASKEDILMAALAEETQQFEQAILAEPVEGPTGKQRILNLYAGLTESLLTRPNYARAILRSVVSGVPTITEKVLSFQQRLILLSIMTIRGDKALLESLDHNEADTRLAFIIEQIWFASLVGWMSGSIHKEMIQPHIEHAVGLLMNGRADA